ncbi:hypothetical protein [Streptomyces sp. NA04227]|uniref:hypothetical protein n=1 Tax=Streptomyces sp. NA04227 TaxID=2742136 RepID=UPI001C376CCA|nr:hypothetical protein [Streptomyces sp. NA04227]
MFGPPDPSYGAAPTWPPAATGQPSYALGNVGHVGHVGHVGYPAAGSDGNDGHDGNATTGTDARPGTGPTPGPDRTDHPAPGTGAGTDPRPAPTGKLSLTVDTASTPVGPNNRGRRLSCTVALAVAGALAAVTVGSVFVFDLVGGSSDNAADGASPSGKQSSTPGDGHSTSVPAGYLGTWEGPARARTNDWPMGTFRLTVKKAAPGEKFAVMRQTDQLGGVCEVDLRLQSVTAREIVANAQGRADSRPTCTKNVHKVHLVLTGQDLSYISENEQSGKPKARMEKVD